VSIPERSSELRPIDLRGRGGEGEEEGSQRNGTEAPPNESHAQRDE
jgi:hypothetical protein